MYLHCRSLRFYRFPSNLVHTFLFVIDGTILLTKIKSISILLIFLGRGEIPQTF